MDKNSVTDSTIKTKPMTILELRAQNVMGLTAVRIHTQGESIVISGENEAGKSSVLNAIEMALRGKAGMPPRPVREGEDSAVIVLDMGEIIVTRTITPDGGGTLKITNRDGLTYPSPQAFANGLFGELSFDPVAFAAMDATDQAATLRRLAGIDTTDLDIEAKRVYEERTLVNRDAKQLEGAVKSAPHYPELDGAELGDPATIAAQLEKANGLADAARTSESSAALAAMRVEAANANARSVDARIANLKAQLEEAELESLEADELVRKAKGEHETAERLYLSAKAQVPDVIAIEQALKSFEATNGKIRANQARKALEIAHAAKKAEAEALTRDINRVATEKADLLAKAEFPVQGLGLDINGGVLWNGLPFAQASTAIRIRASVAIGLAMHPRLNVLLVRNGNDLGQKNLLLLAQAAEDVGAQLWVERIAGGEGLPTIIIEDGAVVAQKEAVNA